MSKGFLGKQNGWGPKDMRDRLKKAGESEGGKNLFEALKAKAGKKEGDDRRLEESKEEMNQV